MTRAGSILKKILLLFLAAFLALLLCEIILEHLAERSHSLPERTKSYYSWSFYTYSGIRLSASKGLLKLRLSPGVVYENAPSQKTPFFSINSSGYRGPEISPLRPGQKRIIVVGGSTAFGTGLNSDGETFAVHLEKLLPGTQVINAAVIGYESGNELALVARSLINLNPNLIIALDGFNDFAEFHNPDWDPHVAGFNCFGVFDLAANQIAFTWEPLGVRLEKIPHIIFPQLINFSLNMENRASLPLNAIRSGNTLLATSDVFAGNVSKMAILSRGSGIAFLDILQPIAPLKPKSKSGLSGNYANFRSEVKRSLLRKDVPLLDINAHMRSFRVQDFMDVVHLDGHGNYLMAHLAAEYIRTHNLLVKRPVPSRNCRRQL
ncbi:MAG TPA: hypothetical protein VNH15_01255 [Elusimicrobiota bacterium]|nr:hypothetical protein [Elusimicrobiota bacterium]